MAALKMVVLEKDKNTGIKFGICCKEYYVYFMEDWHKINVKTINEAKRIYHNICIDHAIDEAKRLNKVLC